MKRRAVIDIGSNTVKLTAFEIKDKKSDSIKLKRVAFSSSALGLIGRRKDNRIEKDAIEELLETLRLYKKTALRAKCTEIFCFATASFRGAENTDEIIRLIKSELDITVDLVDGEREAKYCFRALRHIIGDGRTGLTSDMGGGSTEISLFSGKDITDTVSMPFGCLALYKKYVSGTFPTGYEADNISKYVKSEIEKTGLLLSDSSNVWLTGGTAKAIAKVSAARSGRKYDKDLPYEMSLADFFSTVSYLVEKDEKKEDLLRSLVPSRVTTIVPGALAFGTLLSLTSAESVTVADIGIREGYILTVLDRENARA